MRRLKLFSSFVQVSGAHAPLGGTIPTGKHLVSMSTLEIDLRHPDPEFMPWCENAGCYRVYKPYPHYSMVIETEKLESLESAAREKFCVESFNEVKRSLAVCEPDYKIYGSGIMDVRTHMDVYTR